jgi:hypothetical protein
MVVAKEVELVEVPSKEDKTNKVVDKYMGLLFDVDYFELVANNEGLMATDKNFHS